MTRQTDGYRTREWRRWRNRQFVRTLVLPVALLILAAATAWGALALI
jgi:hypothetical protein